MQQAQTHLRGKVHSILKNNTSTRAFSPITRRAIFLLSLATFSSMALQRICDPMLPELSRVFDAPIGEVSEVISLFALTYGLMQLFYGPVGDRFGKYRVVMLAAIGCSVGSTLSALSANLEILVATRIATALAAAAIIPLTLAWVGDVVHYEQRQETLARVGLGTMLGMTGGQLFGGLLTDTLGWRWAFALMAAVFAVVSFLLWRQLQHLEPVDYHRHEAAGFFHQLKQVANNTWARTLLTVALAEGAMIFGLLAVTASHLHHMHHISLTLAGGTTALYGLGGMAYMALAKFAIRRFGEVGLARWGGMYFGLAFLVVAFCPWWQLALPACFVAGFGFAMFHNTMQAKATQMVPTARATGVTLFAGFLFLGQAIGVLVLAALIEMFDSSRVLGAVAVGVMGLGAFFAYAIAKRNATQADHA
jgi:YNFM family putative membrane transporter